MFLKSYTFRKEEHSDVDKFIENRPRDLFLKHFINEKYSIFSHLHLGRNQHLCDWGLRNNVGGDQIREYLENSIRKYKNEYR